MNRFYTSVLSLAFLLVFTSMVTAQEFVKEGNEKYIQLQDDFSSASRATDAVEEEWMVYGGSARTSNNGFNDIKTDDQGNVYVVGTVDGNATFGSTSVAVSNGNRAVVVGKISKAGQLQWIKVGVGGHSGGIGLDIKGSNLYLCGTFETSLQLGGKTASSPGSRLQEGFVAKMDLNGNTDWITVITGAGTQNCENVKVGKDGDVFISGEFFNNVQLGSKIYTRRGTGEKDMYVACLSSLGAFKWSVDYGSQGRDFLNDMDINGNDQLVLVGSFYNTLEFGDASNNLTTTGSNHYDAYMVVVGNGQFVLKGAFSGDEDVEGSAAGFAPNGRALIAFNFDENIDFFGTEYGQKGGDWGYVMAILSPPNSLNAFISSNDDEFVKAISIDEDGEIFYAQGHIKTASFGDCDIDLKHIDYISQSSFVVRSYDVTSSSGSWDQPSSVYADKDHGIFVSGTYEDKLYFGGDQSSSTAAKMSVALAWSNETPQDTSTTEVIALEEVNGISLYPNPTSELLFLSNLENLSDGMVTVLGLNGSVMIQTDLSAATAGIDISGLQTGQYLLKVKTPELQVVRRFHKL